jgi:hypothetical protein
MGDGLHSGSGGGGGSSGSRASSPIGASPTATGGAVGHQNNGTNNFGAFVVDSLWDPAAPNFEVLNTETPKETRVFFTANNFFKYIIIAFLNSYI